jgi:hypothetical protein
MKSMDILKRAKSESVDEVTLDTKKPKSGKKLNLVLALLLVGALAAGGFFYSKYKSVSSDPKKAVASKNASETKDVLDAVNRVIFTESDKQPTVARVESPDTLKKSNPDFYKNVTNGDYLILYPQRAIVFRKSENKIINVAPIVDTSKLAPANAPAEGTTPASNEVKR